MDPLRRRWRAVQQTVLAALAEQAREATDQADGVILSEGMSVPEHPLHIGPATSGTNPLRS